MYSRLVKILTLGTVRLGLPADQISGKLPTFGIDNLPDNLGVLPCGTPVAFVVSYQAAINIWLPAFFKDSLATSRVFLIADDKTRIDHLLTDPALQTAYESNQLNIMLTRPQINDEIKHRGIHCIFEELEEKGLDDDHTILWIGSHAWLQELSIAQLQEAANHMRHWSAKRKKPVVFVYLNPPDVGALTTKLGKMFGFFPSVAMLAIDRDWPTLSFERWNSDNGAVFELNLGLNENIETHRLGFNGCRTQGSLQDIIEAPDRDVVIVTQAAVAGQRNIPGNWKILSQAGEGAAAVAGSVAATIVLHAGSINDFGTLTRVVHHLRMTHPRSLKIVVRENDAKLRVSTERALIHLGANLIVYREIGFARLIQMIQDIKHQTFSGELDADFDTALSSYKPDIERGYVAPATFCKTILKTLARTEASGITHTLVQLHILPIIPHLDVINSCTVFRDGDLVTADTESIFVFLFACTETDVDSALERLFTVPVTQLFSSQVTESSTDGIKIILDRLFESSRKGLPNYSTEIQYSTKNLVSFAFNDKPSTTHIHVPARVPLLSSPPLMPSLESGVDFQAPTFQPRTIRRHHRASDHKERAA